MPSVSDRTRDCLCDCSGEGEEASERVVRAVSLQESSQTEGPPPVADLLTLLVPVSASERGPGLTPSPPR